MPESWSELENAQQLLASLRTAFAGYATHNEAQRQALKASRKGFAGFFRGMFSPGAVMEREDQDFMDDAAALAGRLAAALSRLPEGEQRRALAVEAVELYLSPKPRDDKTPQDWFMTAAEASCMPLLPYLPSGELSRFRDAILSGTPRRFLFPKQAELLQEIESLLQAAGSDAP